MTNTCILQRFQTHLQIYVTRGHTRQSTFQRQFLPMTCKSWSFHSAQRLSIIPVYWLYQFISLAFTIACCKQAAHLEQKEWWRVKFRGGYFTWNKGAGHELTFYSLYLHKGESRTQNCFLKFLYVLYTVNVFNSTCVNFHGSLYCQLSRWL
jgi:hypothetical protein